MKGSKSLTQESVRAILEKYRTVAIVGVSHDSSKDSYRVAAYLKSQGFRIVPVNPVADEVLGEKSYKSLLDMPAEIQKTIEIVDIFRPSAEVPSIVKQAIQLRKVHDKPHVVWTQLGVVNEEAAEEARTAGLRVVIDKCMMSEHLALTAKV
jgi:predicted CoA-binding protein